MVSTATSAGRAHFAHGVPVWAAWASRIGAHGTNISQPQP